MKDKNFVQRKQMLEAAYEQLVPKTNEPLQKAMGYTIAIKTAPIKTPQGWLHLAHDGWIADNDGTVYIYYASSDTRMHVATSTIEKLVDYATHTPEDGYTTSESVKKSVRDYRL